VRRARAICVTRSDIGAVTSRSALRTDPFGPLTSLVLRDLFAESEGRSDPPAVALEAIATRTALHLSTVCRIASRLSTLGYVERQQRALRLVDRLGALDDWIRSWDATAQVTQSFHVGLAWPALVSMLGSVWHGIDWTWTGGAGAVLAGIAPGTPLHRVCYVTLREFDLACARLDRRLDMRRADEGGTFHIIVPSEARAQLFRTRGARWGTGRVASTIQLALDVASGPDALAPRTAAPALAALCRVLAGLPEPAGGSPTCRTGGAMHTRASACVC
jgi:hypothetical protein